MPIQQLVRRLRPNPVRQAGAALLATAAGLGVAALANHIAARTAELLADPARAAALGAAGRARAVAEFGWDAIAARTLEVYEAALRG